MISSLPSIPEAVQQIQAGQRTPLELVDYCLGRIEQFESRVQAWELIDADGARREAARLGELAGRGQLAGPLHGVPLGIKDIVDVAGWPTKAGSPLRADHIASADAPLVTRLRAAGAILLGKTVTTEFACFDPPRTRNPWDLAHTPGGSSSGSAAAVALEMCQAAIGSQTGGSIIRPASYCGVCGVKPTFGRVPLEGVVPVSSRLDHAGPLARTVCDLECMLGVLAEPAGAAGGAHARAEAFPRLCAVGGYFAERASTEVQRITAAALDRLAAQFGDVPVCPLPESFHAVHEDHRRIMAVDAAAYHRSVFIRARDQFGDRLAELIDEGLATRAVDYADAMRRQHEFQADMAEWFREHPVAVMPATTTTAPGHLDTTGDPSFNSPWSYAGLPAVTVPCGVDTGGLPCGLQLVGPHGSDARLLRTAARCEQLLAFDRRPPLR